MKVKREMDEWKTINGWREMRDEGKSLSFISHLLPSIYLGRKIGDKGR